MDNGKIRKAENQNGGQSTGGSRKQYRRPILTEYGSVSKLTRGTVSHGTDAGTMTKNCL